MYNNLRKLSSTVTKEKIFSYGDMIVSVFSPVILVTMAITAFSEKRKSSSEETDKLIK